MPLDEALKAELIKDYDFNPNAISELLEAYKDTLKFSGLLNSGMEKQVNHAAEIGIVGSERSSGLQKPTVQAKFERSWSLMGGIIAKLQVTDLPNTGDKEFLETCLKRALAELFPEKGID